jgi:hypothetical protein
MISTNILLLQYTSITNAYYDYNKKYDFSFYMGHFCNTNYKMPLFEINVYDVFILNINIYIYYIFSSSLTNINFILVREEENMHIHILI